MATKKISALTAKGFNIQTTDLLEISEYDGVSAYVTKKITGSEIINGIRNVLFYNDFESFPLTGSTGIIYVDKELEEIHLWTGVIYSQIGGGGQNIATNDLVFTANSTTDLAGYKATLDNAEFKIVADANLNADIPFEITQADGTTSILKVKGDKTIEITSDTFFHLSTGSQAQMYMRGTSASRLDLANTTNAGLQIYSDSAVHQIIGVGNIIQSVRSTTPGDAVLDNNTICFFVDGSDLKVKYKNNSGVVTSGTLATLI